jgi:integral membrane sensor domain MASE1
LVTAGIGLGIQWIVPIVAAIIVSVIFLAAGTRQDQLADAITGIVFAVTLACLVLSVIGMFLVLRLAAKAANDDDAEINIPPPPTFENHGQS